jgi:hypothetical protein
MYKGKLHIVEIINSKINKLISENRQNLMTKANNGDVKALWNAVKIASSGRSNNNSLHFDNDDLNNAQKLNEYFSAIAIDPDYNIQTPIKFKMADYLDSTGGTGEQLHIIWAK